MNKYFLLLSLLMASPVLAHTEHGPESLGAGLMHPLTGFDHLLMLSGVGVLSALGNHPKLFLLSTLLAMSAGALGGHLLGTFSGMEILIGFSLLMAGTLIFATVKGKLTWALPMLALAHGWAHGAEGNEDGFWLFAVGFMLGCTAILTVGYGVGVLLRSHPVMRQVAGGAWLAAAIAVIAG